MTIKENKSRIVFLISADVINVLLYEENANYASSRTTTLTNQCCIHIFSGHLSMSSLESPLWTGQPIFSEIIQRKTVSGERNGINKIRILVIDQILFRKNEGSHTANLLLQVWIFSCCLNPDESYRWQPSSCFVIWNTN